MRTKLLAILDRLPNETEVAYEARKNIAEQTGIRPLPLDVMTGTRALTVLCHGLAAESGWWSDRKTGEPLTLEQVNIPEKLCLIHSEISEAMEGVRKDLMDDKLPHRKMLEVELADALIRIFDLAGFLNLDLAGATIEKLAFNQQRADHKLANRNAEGGKAF